MNDNNDIEQKRKIAEDLFKLHMAEITETQEQMVKHMIEQGYDPLIWGLADNLKEIQAGNTLEYRCWPVLLKKPVDISQKSNKLTTPNQ